MRILKNKRQFYLQEVDLGYASGVRAFRTSCFGNQENDWKLLVPSEVRRKHENGAFVVL